MKSTKKQRTMSTSSGAGRRLARSVAALVAAAGLMVGCGAGSDTSGGGEKTIAISFPNYSRTPALQVEMKAAEEEAKKRGYTLVLDDPGSDLDKQVSTIKTWIPQEYDAIIAVALDSTVMTGIAKEATGAGIKWINYGSTLDGQTGEVDMQQEAGGKVLGELAATWFEENLDGKGEVALLTYEEGEWARARREGIEAALKAQVPNVKIVAQEDAISETEGLDAASNLLQAHPDLNAILAIEESASVGAYGALKDKKDPTMFIGGMDGTKEALTAMGVEGSAYRGSAALDLKAIGRGMIDAAANAAEGTGESTYEVTYTPVTPGSEELQTMLGMWE